MSEVATVLIPDDSGVMQSDGSPAMREVRLGAVLRESKPPVKFKAFYSDPATVPVPPAVVEYAAKATIALKRMYLNDKYGDCVIAGKCHQLGIWSGNDSDSGGVVQATDDEVYKQYMKLAYKPNTDSGCVITDVLDYFTRTGLTANGKVYKIDGYVPIDNTDPLEVKVAILLFGSLTLGINLPQAWTTGGDGSTWDLTNTGSVGGHDVAAVGYNEKGVVVSTWGGLRTITWAAFTSKRYITELYAELGQVWYGADAVASALGFDVVRLKKAINEFAAGQLPSIDPEKPLPPPPPPPVTPPSGSVTLPLSLDSGAVKKALETQGWVVTSPVKLSDAIRELMPTVEVAKFTVAGAVDWSSLLAVLIPLLIELLKKK